MSFYSDNNVATKYLDPKIYVENARCSFSLDASEAAYLPNLRLTFVGVTNATGQTAYNKLVGAKAVIRSIRLLDGKQELSALNRAQFYTGFVNANKTNERNQSVDSFKECTQIGLTINGENRKIDRIARFFTSQTTLANTGSAIIDLRSMLPMLNAVSHLPTAVFKNLRLEVEFDSVIANQVLNSQIVTPTTIRPVLAVDVLENPTVVDNLNKRLRAAMWLEVEHDQYEIPQSANNGGVGDQLLAQNVNVKINGFNNKSLERVLIVKEIGNAALETSAGSVQGYGKFSSQSCFRQKVQFRVNGRNILPREGIVGNNERLARVVDTFGDMSAYIGSNQYGTDTTDVMEEGRAFLGQQDYIGIYVGKQIDDLQINFERTGLQDATTKRPTTERLVAHVYGEVRKSFQMLPNGLYNIAYA
jgi:hypothetical protein